MMFTRQNHSWSLKYFDTWSDTRIAFAVYIISQIFFLIFLFRAIPSGDATEGLHQIIQLDIHLRATFVGYHALGILFTQALSIFGISEITALNFMSSLFGAIGAAFTYKFAKHFLGDTKDALLATAFTIFSGVYWLFSEIGDTYIVHTAFLIISLVMFLEKRYVLSGITYGVALLVYPLVGWVSPFYPVVAYRYRYGFINFLKTFLSAAIVYLPPVIILFQEYFYQRMGMYPSFMSISIFMSSFDIIYLFKGTYNLVKSFHIALPLIIVGLIICFKRYHFFSFLTLLLTPIHFIYSIAFPNELDSYLISIVPFLGILIVVGLTTILGYSIFHRHYLKTLLAVIFIYVILSFVLMVGPIKKGFHDLRNFAESFHLSKTGDYRIISRPSTCKNYNFYTSSTLYSGKCVEHEELIDKTFRGFLSKNIPLYFFNPLVNPLDRAVMNLLPGRYVRNVKKRRSIHGEKILEICPECKLKLIETTPFNLYEVSY